MQSLSGGSEHANPRDSVEEERCEAPEEQTGVVGHCREWWFISPQKLVRFF